MIKRFFGMLLLGTGLAGTLCCANEPYRKCGCDCYTDIYSG